MFLLKYGLVSDINECKNESLEDCHDEAECYNSVGDYSCSCNTGYRGDGRTCSGDVIKHLLSMTQLNIHIYILVAVSYDVLCDICPGRSLRERDEKHYTFNEVSCNV